MKLGLGVFALQVFFTKLFIVILSGSLLSLALLPN